MIFGMVGFGQSPIVKPVCVTDQLMNSLIKEHPELRARLDKMDEDINKNRFVKRSTSAATNLVNSMITIPVVVYVVHSGVPIGTAENISDLQVTSQITALNAAFNPYNINFCLATKAGSVALPINNSTIDVQNTPGIIHVKDASYTDQYSNESYQQALVNHANALITSTKYLRIFVVRSIDGASSGTLGYSMFPNSSSSFDGVVMRYDAFGDINSCGVCSLVPSNSAGKVLVHEIGHYLYLYHTFQEACTGTTLTDCSTGGDRVCDTPQVKAPNTGCPSGILDSCLGETAPNGSNLPDQINNYMDYTNDACRNLFTPGQVTRMITTLNQYRGSLFTNDNLIYTGACGATNLFVSNFTPSTSATNPTYQVCTATNVTFTPVTTDATSYNWNFGDTINNTSTAQIGQHVFSSAVNSPYTVTLTIVKGGVTLTQTAQIYVSSCTAINNTESNWCFSTSNGLKFNTGVPVLGTINNNNIQEACAVQSDATGNLLFYTNGVNVWNKTHALINTTSLLGDTYSNQGTIITPDPGNANQYYIFTTNEDNLLNGFRYSKVNVSGTTATMSTDINHAIVVSGYKSGNDSAVISGEGINAMQKCDGYWIITTLKKASGGFDVGVFSLTSTGLSLTSAFTAIPTNFYTGSEGKIEIAPNGNKIAVASQTGGTYLFDFNKYNGTLSNPVIISNNTTFYSINYMQGISFSPDSNLLYISYTKQLIQYNVNSANITNNGKVINTITDPISGQLAEIQKGPDGKIYVGQLYRNKLGVIHNPNNVATISNPNSCQYSDNGPVLNTALFAALPNMIDAKTATVFDATNKISVYVTGCKTYSFFPNVCGYSSFTWDFGDSTTSTATIASHTYALAGTYTVTLKNGTTLLATKSIVVTNMVTPVILGSSSVACSSGTNSYDVSNNSVVLQNGQTATWSVSGGTIQGFNNQSNITVNWSSFPRTINLLVTDVSGCTATATQTITSLCAVNDNSTDCTGSSTLNLLSNDTYNGVAATSSNVSISIIGSLPTGFTFNATNGVLAHNYTAIPNTYIINYRICSLANPSICSTATATIIIKPFIVSANDDDFSATPFNPGDITPSVLTNDSAQCFIFNGRNIAYLGITNDGGLTDVSMDFNGIISMPQSAFPGTYLITYQLCFNFNPVVGTTIPYCDTAVVTIVVPNPFGKASDKVVDNNDITIYPNPTSSIINIDLNQRNEGATDFVIRDIQEKQITRYTQVLKKGKQTVEIELPNSISEGTYTVEITSNVNDYKVVKQLIVKK